MCPNQIMNFQVVSDYQPKGDQPLAIDKLSQGIVDGEKFQTLLGVTGSGKTFTVANVTPVSFGSLIFSNEFKS